MKKSECINLIKQMLQTKLGMKRTMVKHAEYESECFVLNNEYYRLDSFPSLKENVGTLFCIEWAENQEEAALNHFEDAWLYPANVDLDELLALMERDILNG